MVQLSLLCWKLSIKGLRLSGTTATFNLSSASNADKFIVVSFLLFIRFKQLHSLLLQAFQKVLPLLLICSDHPHLVCPVDWVNLRPGSGSSCSYLLGLCKNQQCSLRSTLPHLVTLLQKPDDSPPLGDVHRLHNCSKLVAGKRLPRYLSWHSRYKEMAVISQLDAEYGLSMWMESRQDQCLLSIWSDESIQSKLGKSNVSQAIYEAMATQMVEIGYNRSWLQCQRKIEHMKLANRNTKVTTGCNVVWTTCVLL